MTLRFIRLGLALFVSVPLGAAAPLTLRYEPEVVRLTGLITTKVSRGNYLTVEPGDQPEEFFILRLEQPINLAAANDADDLTRAEKGVRELQLAGFVGTSGNGHVDHRAVLGHAAVVTGTLFHAFTVHHKTRVLLLVNHVEMISHPPAPSIGATPMN